jgi:hypothetical protein
MDIPVAGVSGYIYYFYPAPCIYQNTKKKNWKSKRRPAGAA